MDKRTLIFLDDFIANGSSYKRDVLTVDTVKILIGIIKDQENRISKLEERFTKDITDREER